MSEHRSTVVVDLGFGDAGKGTVVDFLVRDRSAHTVVRFNGGAQAGHNVVTDDGRHHCFAQLGAGSFVPGVRTHLSRFMVVHPTALLVEAKRIAEVGVPDVLSRLTISEDALVTPPHVQALGRIRELARGDAPHGTTGVGVGETMRLSIEHPDLAIRVRDLARPASLRRSLLRLRDWAVAEADALPIRDARAAAERDWLSRTDSIDTWLEACAPLISTDPFVDSEHLARSLAAPGEVVFEGAQGVLLDEWRGFHPHTTWSTCTTQNALELLRGYSGEVERLGVLRSYATRHGAGPFPSHARSLRRLSEPHNSDVGWQGRFRRGWLDLPLLRYALACCEVDGLALTHLDRVTPGWNACVAYENLSRPLEPSADSQDLEHAEALGHALRGVRPVLERTPVDLPQWVEERLNMPVRLVSEGPTASAKRWRSTGGRSGARRSRATGEPAPPASHPPSVSSR